MRRRCWSCRAAAGAKDAQTTLRHPDWTGQQTGLDGLQLSDLSEHDL